MKSLHRFDRRALRPRATVLILFLASTALGCGGSGTEPNPSVKVSSVSIDQGSFLIERGYHQALTTTVKNDAGATVPVPVAWRSSNEKVATVDANGRLAALDTGNTVVTAATLGVTSQPVAVRVVWQGPAKIETYQFTAPGAASPSVTIADSIRARVLNLAGNPVPGVRVVFTSTAGGGSISPAIYTTDRNGVAATQWTLGNSNGPNQVTASVLSDDDQPVAFVQGTPATFVITTFDAVRAVDGDGQTAQILSRLPVAPSVKVVDVNGNPRPGVPVTFTPTAGGRVTTAAVSTGADGIASPGTWTLGDVTGDQQLLVKVESASLSLHATGTGAAIHFVPVSASAGGFATCAIITNGTVSCWGEQPKVGDGTTINRSTPTPTSGGVQFASVVGSPGFIDQQSGIGVAHFCGVAGDQAIYCWGINALADTLGTTVSTNVPARLTGTRTWTQVAPGVGHNCAISTDQNSYCWGDNSVGQLGDPTTTTTRFAPAQVYGSFHFTSLVSGSYHSCGLSADGSAFCWGLNQNGQLGDGTTVNRVAPTAVSGGLAFQSISAGEALTCGLTVAGKTYCWGRVSSAAQIQTTPKDYPTAPTFTSLSVGGAHACALTGDGTAYCWGDNRAGQLGDSSTTNRSDPVPVAGGLKFKAISAGYLHSCARTLDGSLACWGMNKAGERGDTTAANRLVPRFLVLGVSP